MNSSSKKRVLFHLMRPSIPCDTGDKRRSIGILKYLKSREDIFTVDIFSANSYRNLIWTTEDKNRTREVCSNLFIYEGQDSKIDFIYSRAQSIWHQRILGEILPVDSDYYTPIGFSNFFRSLLSKKHYDYVWLTMVEHAQLVNCLIGSQSVSMLDMQDLCCEGRQVSLKTAGFARGLKFDYERNFKKEVKLLNKFDRVVTNSISETEKIKPFLSESKLSLVPHPLGRESSQSKVPYSGRDQIYDMLFVGTSRVANVEGVEFFLREVYPIVLEKLPNATLALVGSVAEAAKYDISLEKNVKRVGYVDELAGAYLSSKLFICPLLSGAGTKVKLQEAIEFSLPIVATPTGASGLCLQDGKSAIIQTDPVALAKGIITLLSKYKNAQAMSDEVLKVYREHYSNDVIKSKLDRLFEAA